MREGTPKWRQRPCLWINTDKISFLSNLYIDLMQSQLKSQQAPLQMLTAKSKINVEMQGKQNIQYNFEKEQSGLTHHLTLDFSIKLH